MLGMATACFEHGRECVMVETDDVDEPEIDRGVVVTAQEVEIEREHPRC